MYKSHLFYQSTQSHEKQQKWVFSICKNDFYLLADADIEASTIKDHLLYTHTRNRVSVLVYGAKDCASCLFAHG